MFDRNILYRIALHRVALCVVVVSDIVYYRIIVYDTGRYSHEVIVRFVV